MMQYILIIILGGMITLGISNISQNSTVNQGTQNVVDNFANNRVHDIASSMVNILLLRLANDIEYREPGELEDLFEGEVTYSVEDTFFDNDSLIKIIVNAAYDDITKTITVYTEKPTNGWVPPIVRGAWTANANLNNTISDMYIDGRDHDLDLNLIPTTGVFGVSTSVTFVNVENAAIGGTNNFIDYPMTYPEIPEVIEENYNWGGGFPESPDEILGYPEGTLKAAAQTGEYGSQYLYQPGKYKDGKHWFIDGLTYPLSGVTYIEITNAADIMGLMLQQNGNSGIVVVHHPAGKSKINGIKFNKDNSDGLLTGLLITDYSFHHHIDILGSIIMLSPDLETSKNCNGNKDHWAYYSSEAVRNATEIAAEITGLSGQVGYGFGKKRVNIRYVYE